MAWDFVQKGKLLFECDGCSIVEEFDGDDFDAAWKSLEDQGWRARKIGGIWTHTCQRCGTNS
jgi:hypothetical protein